MNYAYLFNINFEYFVTVRTFSQPVRTVSDLLEEWSFKFYIDFEHIDADARPHPEHARIFYLRFL